MGCTSSVLARINVSGHPFSKEIRLNAGHSATIISAVKLYEIKALNESKDVPYASVNLSILSVTEVFVGTLTASLPPLRLLFETLLNKIHPESATSTRGRSHENSYVLPPYGMNRNTVQMKPGRESDDNSSVRTMLKIKKTTHVSMTVDRLPHPNHGAEGWS